MFCRRTRVIHKKSGYRRLTAISPVRRSSLETLSFSLPSSPLVTPSLEERVHDLVPFSLKSPLIHLFSSGAVPVRGVTHIALLSMEVGVHPRGIWSLLFLHHFVRSVPSPASVVPQREQFSGERRRLPFLDTRKKFLDGHRAFNPEMTSGTRSPPASARAMDTRLSFRPRQNPPSAPPPPQTRGSRSMREAVLRERILRKTS